MRDVIAREALDTLRLVQERANFRKDRRKTLERIDAAATSLKNASGGGTGTSVRAPSDFSDLQVVGGVLTEAVEAAGTLDKLGKSIAALEAELAQARAAARTRKISLIIGTIVAAIVLFYVGFR